MKRLAWLALVPLAACGPDDTTSACKDSFVAGDLVITEVFADYAAPEGGTGADDGKEWFEIYNNSDRPVSLKGVTVVHSKMDGSDPSTHTMDDVTIAPGQFFTLGNATQDLLPPYVDYGFSADLNDFYNSGGGQLTLRCGTQEIDNAMYESVKSGRSRQLTSQSPPDYSVNDDPANWCEAKDSEFESNNFGTPGSDNDCAPVIMGACSDNGVSREVVAPVAGDLVITEMMPRPTVGAANGEWFEVLALADVDLNGLALDRAGDSSAPNIVESPSCLRVSAGEYAVFARNGDSATNGGLPAVAGTFSFSLVDSNGDIQILSGGVPLDAVTWPSSRAARALQVDPDFADPTGNDQTSNFCDATTPFGADYGTPGEANTECAAQPQPGMCDDNGTPRAIVKPSAGALVITEVMPNPTYVSGMPGSEASREWFEIKNTSGTAFDLNELSVDRVSDSAMPTEISSVACKSVPPGGYALIARSADMTQNSGLPTPDATFTFSMPNTGGDVRVLDGVTELDAMVYGSVSTTSTYDGKSLSLDPDFQTTTGNDGAVPPVSSGNPWCLGATVYGETNQGTPRAANPQCP